MTVHAFASLTGSPGVTTSALAAAVHWPRPVVVVEAETANATSSMPGFFRSNLRPDAGGLDKIALAYSRGALAWRDVLDPEAGLAIAVHDLPPVPAMPIPTLPQGHRMWVVPGFYHLGIVGGVHGLWSRLPQLLRALSESDVDVIVDLGRIGHDDIRLPLLDGADRVTFFANASMVDLNRLLRRLELPDLSERLEGAGRAEKYRLVLVQPPHEGVPPHAFSEHVLPVASLLPFDPDGAAVFALGRPDIRPARNAYRQGTIRLVNSLADAVGGELDRKAAS